MSEKEPSEYLDESIAKAIKDLKVEVKVEGHTITVTIKNGNTIISSDSATLPS
jgi:frataxin-like iron-binding protein CyaY